MKNLIIGTSLTVALMLAGCAEENADTKKSEHSTASKTEKKEETNSEEKEVATEDSSVKKEETAKVEKSEMGTKTIHFTNKKLGISTKLGPINFHINMVQTSRLKINKGYEDMFDDKNEVTLIVLNVDVENTIDDSTNFYPNQATLTTNTGEQINAEVVYSDDVGGEFIGKVKKSGNIIFVAQSNPKEITNVKFIVEGPSDASFTSLTDRYTVEIPTKN
ncbi:hypothetical protein QK289_03965 [Exiguobacterium antarcticum]|uniref:DUF4352 domain-containing protein n=1 Tax=Exiguobacterium antarcticum TaxID=132920 RepID=A0ABT6R019_9BACL|nr:hypothetical protein [Exiguobacterium antarcticum]MDI3234153.1 hypothetical protein [Exiguobacterium antarcticum]